MNRPKPKAPPMYAPLRALRSSFSARLNNANRLPSVSQIKGNQATGAYASTLATPNRKAASTCSVIGLGRGIHILHSADKQRVQSATVSAQNLKAQAAKFNGFVAIGHPPQMIQDQTTHGMAVLVTEMGAEKRIKILDGRLRLDAVTPHVIKPDIVVGFIKIILVFDVTDDLFEDVFDGNQTANTRIFVDDHGHMIVRDAKLAQ